MRRGTLLTGLVVLAVAAIGIAATVDAVRGGRGASSADPPAGVSGEDGVTQERLAGPDLPSPGALAGMLVFADRAEGCRLATLSFATLRFVPTALDTDCTVWASSLGRLAVVSPSGAEQPLSLVRVRPKAEALDGLGEVLGDPTWAPDGSRLAWCGGGEGKIYSVVVATPAESKRESLPGCSPRFAADGSLLMRSITGTEIWSESGVELGEQEILSGLAGPDGQPDVLGFDRSPDGTLAVAAAIRGAPDTTRLELWENGSLAVSVPVVGAAGIGELLRFSPDGSVFAIGPRPDRVGGPVTFVDLRLRRSTLDVVASGGFAWSPDGAWLAVAGDEEIAIYSRDSDEPVYRLPLAVRGLNWVAEPGR